MMTRYIASAALMLTAGLCAADSITFGGATLHDVYILEGESMYYVEVPSSGRVLSVAKTEVGEGDVVIDPDEQRRTALRREWKKNNDALGGRTQTQTTDSESTERNTWRRALAHDDLLAGPRTNARDKRDETETDERISRIKLEDIPLRDALKATLRSADLDYLAEEGYLHIFRPSQRRRLGERPETRSYQLRQPGSETLPKIVLGNPAGAGGAAPGAGIMSQPGTGYGRGSGPGQSGYTRDYGQARGADSTSAYGANYGSGYNTGYRGGYTGAAGPFSGRGPGRIGGGARFNNIAELFSNIDDRLVGEPPATIGMGGLPQQNSP